MVNHMKAVARQPQELTVEERNLLSVAYKNVIGSRRASWRVISSIEQKGDADKLTLIQSYKKKIETELEEICSDILEIIKNELIPNSQSEEGKVFYYKMKGDYHRYVCISEWLKLLDSLVVNVSLYFCSICRYLAEFQSGDVRKESAAKALEAYTSASKIATNNLAPTHPIRLGLALNFSVFYYEILNSPNNACQLAKQVSDGCLRRSALIYMLTTIYMYRLLTMLSLSWTPCPRSHTRTLP